MLYDFKKSFLIVTFLFISCAAHAQEMLVYCQSASSFLDSTFKPKSKICKWDTYLVEDAKVYKRLYWHAISLRTGKSGYIEKASFKIETTFSHADTGDVHLERARKYCNPSVVRLINSSKNIDINVLCNGKGNNIKALSTVTLRPPAGKLRYKVSVYGLEPYYAQETVQPFQIVDLDFYLE